MSALRQALQAPAYVEEKQVPSPRQLLLPRNERMHVTRRTPQFCLVADAGLVATLPLLLRVGPKQNP